MEIGVWHTSGERLVARSCSLRAVGRRRAVVWGAQKEAGVGLSLGR